MATGERRMRARVEEARQKWPEFMAGYKRPATIGAQLEVALAEAMRAHPKQRLGQIIANYVLTGDLFNVTDEAMLNGLRQAAAMQTIDQAIGQEGVRSDDDVSAG